MPDELWMEVHDIVQETGIKTMPMEKKCNKAKWLSGDALQIAVKKKFRSLAHFKIRFWYLAIEFSVQFICSVVSNFCSPMNCSTPGLPVHDQLLEPTQTHVH